MARLQESGSPIDLITLAESLERQGSWTASAASPIWQNCQKHAKCGEHQRLCRHRARTRRCARMISVANEIAEAGFDPQGRTSEDLLDLAESRVSKSPKAAPTKTKARKTSPMCSTPPLRVSNSCSSSRMTASPGSIPAMTISTKNRRPAAVGSDYRRRASVDG
jgi:replicative DNA helicase